MKRETVKTIVLMLICAAGGLLIGFNAGLMTKGIHALLFVLGIALLAGSAIFAGLLEAVWKQKK